MRSAGSVGKHIVVQGGTFLNDAVLRALENLLEVNVVRPDIAGHMGAFGASLEARDWWLNATKQGTEIRKSSLMSLVELKQLQWDTANRRCGKCSNNWLNDCIHVTYFLVC